MCIRDRYQRRVHGVARSEESAEEEFKEGGTMPEVRSPEENPPEVVLDRGLRHLQRQLIMQHLFNGLNLSDPPLRRGLMLPGLNGLSGQGHPLDEIIDASILVNLILAGPSGGQYSRPEGASQSQINRLPTKRIEKAMLDRLESDDDRCLCRICLIDYEEGDEARTMPCFHYFHKACIDIWLTKKPYLSLIHI
eukprot:TRINITY_DN12142_c0_g1_i3.p1 TRINITY_DN12142_c0_g1~~TRINITY_DN12142_c0_g1_i3.p1  ORF type:complete len:217 (-),score=48.32 TRINITY_DN12142_c0_g1_i3:60-638(-)